MRKIYIATHGDFSKGLKHSLEMIVGEAAKEIQTFSLYPWESATDFSEKLKKELAQNKVDDYILLGDLFGASVVNALLETTAFKNVILISGVNLNLALELLLAGPERLTEEEIQEIIFQAQQGIRRVTIENLENEEF
ncbi:PTS sugar transporter subunit IIA [Enterococcus rivorum]|uniref:PTS sugar transporter subunit IIA n=1 Tax=Enterococcus rivorum TaxID=762845 RepID=A0A1E5KSM4_9ENTE|nr:PTS sugar transporter subunit IIA [Enterococcus rivorum]MBP2098205.1 PTS system mannose-specific IIA component/fructoselysine and glucoselysine-specific PTS system IIA component [Enterococcus rivorum]OEH80874.1 PTS sugar transporter subunit IIA [Enterococcus rivorum]